MDGGLAIADFMRASAYPSPNPGANVVAYYLPHQYPDRCTNGITNAFAH